MKKTTLTLMVITLITSAFAHTTTETILQDKGKKEQGYRASTADKKLKIVNLHELEGQVKAEMDKGAFGYIVGGSEDQNNLKINTENFDKKYIMPRVLKGIKHEDIDLSTSLFGIPLKTPIIQAPMAAQGLSHVDGEVATAKGMIAAGSLFSLSTYGNKTIEEVAEGINGAPFFFQLYMSKNDDFNKFTLERAKKHGAKAIILTVDSPVGGYREEDIKTGFTFPLVMGNLELFAAQQTDGNKTGKGAGITEIYAQAKQDFKPTDIKYVKDMTGLPVIVKGIQSPEDAEIAIQAGADAIWVSNHGGRQLDAGPSSFDVLPLVAKTVNKRVPIIFDSGVRRGSHIFKALASGADIVAIGRPILYALHLGGSQGVTSVIDQLNKELIINMFLGGAKNIQEIQNTKLYTDKDLSI